MGHEYAICIENKRYQDKLVKYAIYQIFSDSILESYGLVSVINDIYEYYLCDASCFVIINKDSENGF